MRDSVESHARYPTVKAARDGVELMTIIKELSHTYEGHNKVDDQVHDVLKKFYSRTQGARESLQKYYEGTVAFVESIKSMGISLSQELVVTDNARSNEREAATEEDRHAATERAIAMAFISGASGKYAEYHKHLRNCHLDGHDNYPKTIHEAYNILQRREVDGGVSHGGDNRVAFVNNGATSSVTSTARRFQTPRSCFRCHSVEHLIAACPHPEDYQPPAIVASQEGAAGSGANSTAASGGASGAVMATQGIAGGESASYAFAHHSINIPETGVLLDNQSTVDLFWNKKMLTNIRTVPTWMHVKCNAGTVKTNMMGDLAGYGPVWWHPEGLANILSMSQVIDKGFEVEFVMRGVERPMFVVYKPDGARREFVRTESGLYMCNELAQQNGVALVSTVAGNRTNYTHDDYLRAVRARELQIMIGRPSTKDFIRIVLGNQLPNCPVTKADILAAEDIFGPDVGSLKGKTTRRPPSKVKPW
jgi:hypothetical protein